MISSNFEIIGQFWCALFLILNGLNQLYNRYCELVPPLEIFFLLVFVHVYSQKINNKHVNCFISIFKALPKLFFFFVEFIFLKRNGIMLVTTINNILKKNYFLFRGDAFLLWPCWTKEPKRDFITTFRSVLKLTLKRSKSAWGISITTLDTVDDFETLASCCFAAYQCMKGIYLLQNQIFTLRRNYISNNFFIISHKFFILYIIYVFFFVYVKKTWNSNIITINKFLFLLL